MSMTVRFGLLQFARPLVGAGTALTLLIGSVGTTWAQNAPPPAPAQQAYPPQQPQPAYPPQQAQPTYPAQQAAPPPGQQPGAYQAPPQGQYPQQQQQPPPPPGQYQPAPSPLYPQQASLPPPQVAWHPPRKPSRGLMITGISILSASYLLAISVAASIMDGDEDGDDGLDCRYCEDVAPYLFIPVIGPFISMTQTPNDAGLMMLGLVEMVGAGLMIGGIIRYKNTKRAAEMQQFGHFQLKGDRELVLGVSSSARMAGPRLTLRF
jgi:hypothetical protein